jgi:HSP20 family protein
MAITRIDNLRDFVTVQRRLNSLFHELNQGQQEKDSTAAASFAPLTDVYEDEQKVVLKLEVPGMKREDLDIQIENKTLTIRGERKFETEEKQENFRRIERRYGSFFRAFTLPGTLDTEQIKAGYDAGVLRIELQKRAEAKPKQIKVQIAA